MCLYQILSIEAEKTGTIEYFQSSVYVRREKSTNTNVNKKTLGRHQVCQV